MRARQTDDSTSTQPVDISATASESTSRALSVSAGSAPTGLDALAQMASVAAPQAARANHYTAPPVMAAAADPAGGHASGATPNQGPDWRGTPGPFLQVSEPCILPGHTEAADPPPASVAVSGTSSVDVPPDPSWQCSGRYLAALLARYDTLAGHELATLDTLINRHQRRGLQIFLWRLRME